MSIPSNIIVNADDFGLNDSVNRAILFCFEQGYINSTSMITNTAFFEESVDLVHKNPVIQNVGLHVNLIEGKPVTRLDNHFFIDENGNWNAAKVKRTIGLIDKQTENILEKEVFAQIDKAFQNGISVTHLDSHYHMHTLPHFYRMFVKAAEYFKIKLRLAQTYNQGNIFKFTYRKIFNALVKFRRNNYSDYFENIDFFLGSRKAVPPNKTIEIMLHPDFKPTGELTDHFDNKAVGAWVDYLQQKNMGDGSTLKN